ncbi:uncharacterized protein LOC126235616 [Schistocerca nitens]|uniref:uncharacterized protein LOC126235616 n=1 Tax=Schistocerca nitens TaxID=7011 RepID=UPI002118D1B0|nr:uncharacterized protein LOC126235616 [Schistocerca nitens]
MRMNFKSGIMNTLEGLIALSQTLSIHLISGENEVKLHAENVFLWLKSDTVKSLSAAVVPSGENTNGVKISGDLSAYLDTVSDSIKLQDGLDNKRKRSTAG